MGATAPPREPRVSRDTRPRSFPQRRAHAGQRRAVHVVGPQQHRHALVLVRNPVVLVPVRAAPPRGGAEDVSARHAECFGVGVAGVGELRLALEHQEPGPPVGMRDQHGAARVPEQVLELHPGLRDRDPDAPSRGYTVTMLSCGIPFRRNEVSTPCGLSWMNCSIWGASWDTIGIYCAPWWTRRHLQ